jgi:hypothetical protein
MDKLPYRNTVKEKGNFKFDLDLRYINKIDYKPNGFWYQINYSLFKDYKSHWGNFIYGVEIKNNILNKEKGILSIKNLEELDKFNKKYGIIKKNRTLINWKKVSKDYGGFEIKNYNNIKEHTDYFDNYEWAYSFTFSSGCIWDLDLIKDISFYKKLTNKEIEEY